MMITSMGNGTERKMIKSIDINRDAKECIATSKNDRGTKDTKEGKATTNWDTRRLHREHLVSQNTFVSQRGSIAELEKKMWRH